jgi:iodotyrosine deiodinase
VTGNADYRSVPLQFGRLTADEQRRRAAAFREMLGSRRTVRDFSAEPVPRDLIREIVATAATAPSGANQQPWRFVVVANPEIKRRIREAAEDEERENYRRRFPDAWKHHLAPLGTDASKPFLEVAPYLIVVFRISYDEREKHYYVIESVGIACGMLIAAIHNAGLVTVPHTPNPMGFLSRILERPKNERPFLLLPVGYPADGARVPDIERKPFDEVAIFVD